MAVNEEHLRLLVEVKGDQALKGLEAELADIEARMGGYTAMFKAGAMTEKLFDDVTKELVVRQGALRDQIKLLTPVTVDFTEAVRRQAEATAHAAAATAAAEARRSAALRTSVVYTDQAHKSNMRFAQGLGQIGYMADDVQYGVHAIINNIQPMIAAFGGPVGLAGAIGITVVALNQLYQNWDKIKTAFGQGGNFKVPLSTLKELDKQLKETKDALEEMAKKQSMTNVEVEKFNKLTAEEIKLEKERNEEAKRKAEIETLKKLKPEGAESGERAKALQTAIGNNADITGLIGGLAEKADTPGTGIRGAAEAEQRKVDAELRKTIEDYRDRWKPGMAQEQDVPEIQKLYARFREMHELVTSPEKAEGLANDAVTRGDTKATKTITDLMGKHPSLFPSGQVGAFQSQTPEGLAATEKAKADTSALLQRGATSLQRMMADQRARVSARDVGEERQRQEKVDAQNARLQEDINAEFAPKGKVPFTGPPPLSDKRVSARIARAHARREAEKEEINKKAKNRNIQEVNRQWMGTNKVTPPAGWKAGQSMDAVKDAAEAAVRAAETNGQALGSAGGATDNLLQRAQRAEAEAKKHHRNFQSLERRTGQMGNTFLDSSGP